MPMWAHIYDAPPIMLFEPVAREIGAELGKVLEVDVDREGRIWGDYMRVRINHDVDEPIRSKIEIYDRAEGKLYKLNVKYERLPRFCSSCGHLGHGQRDCKLPDDLQEMRFSAAMRASPFKRSQSRGGVVVPEASSARRFLLFESDRGGDRLMATQKGATVRNGSVPEEVLADPLVQEAIAAVSAIRLDTRGGATATISLTKIGHQPGVADGGTNLLPARTVLAQPVPSTSVWTGARAVLEGPEFPPGFEPVQQRGLDTTEDLSAISTLREGTKADGSVAPTGDQQNTVMVHGQVDPRVTASEDGRTKELAKGGKIRKMGEDPGRVKTQAAVVEANTKDASEGNTAWKGGGNKRKKVSPKCKGGGQAHNGSVLGKRDAGEQEKKGATKPSDERVDSKQFKKKKGEEHANGQSNTGQNGGQEATEPGALGQLVGAPVSTCQEP